MSNYTSYEQSGLILLAETATEKVLERIFAGAQGNWHVYGEEGLTVCSYQFWAEGNYTPNGPDHDAMLDRLVGEGYNLAAWRELVMSDSENGGIHRESRVRGTPEQQRLFRLSEIDEEISQLEAERTELLSGDGST